jgi:hypothetical protein
MEADCGVVGMDGARMLLDLIAEHGFAVGRLRGVFHLMIGRKITTTNGVVLSAGLTWRQLAMLLRASKFDKELVYELGADPDALAPRDRERMWYSAIALAKVNSVEAHQQAEELVALLRPLGYEISPSPVAVPHAMPQTVEDSTKDDPKKKRKKS